jgi:hypothetical protein
MYIADLCFFADQKMSFQLTTLVLVLDGSNYQQWASAMQSYLMAQGLWKCVKADCTIPSLGYSTKEEGITDSKGKARAIEVTRMVNQDEVNIWYEAAEKALGSIHLRLVDNIGIQHSEINDPADLWKALLEAHGRPGMAPAFAEFKGAMDAVIPNGSDPSPALGQAPRPFDQP